MRRAGLLGILCRAEEREWHLAHHTIRACLGRMNRSIEADVEQRLQLMQAVISVAVMALHRQNAEADCDIALVLDHHAITPSRQRATTPCAIADGCLDPR